MADITNNVVQTTNFVIDGITWCINMITKLFMSIGPFELVVFAVIGVLIYFWLNQHNIEPKRLAKF